MTSLRILAFILIVLAAAAAGGEEGWESSSRPTPGPCPDGTYDCLFVKLIYDSPQELQEELAAIRSRLDKCEQRLDELQGVIRIGQKYHVVAGVEYCLIKPDGSLGNCWDIDGLDAALNAAIAKDEPCYLGQDRLDCWSGSAAQLQEQQHD